MSELKTRFIDDTYVEYYNTGKHDLAQVYLKSEVDRYISELIADQQLELDEWYRRVEHQKYKRCMAMAEWCNSEMGRETFACFRPRHTKEVWREEHRHWAKWRKIWFELYKKFKWTE